MSKHVLVLTSGLILLSGIAAKAQTPIVNSANQSCLETQAGRPGTAGGVVQNACE